MRLIKNSIVILVFLGIVFSSCEKFEDYNVNPEVSSFANPSHQFNSVQMYLLGDHHEHWHMNLGIMSGIAQHIAGAWEIGAARAAWGGHEYSYFDWWENSWAHVYKDIVDLVERTKDDPQYVNINSAARILKVFAFAKLTDAYGDIPYSAAGKSYYTGEFNIPYDSQEDIYNDFFLELDAAVKTFNESASKIEVDAIFNGNIDQWRKFGNSLRLRLAMRLSKVNATKAQSEVQAAIAGTGGLMTSNNDIAMMIHMNFDAEDVRNNPVSEVLGRPGFSEFGICATLSDYLVNTNDPRLDVLFAAYADGDGTDSNIVHLTGYNGLAPASYAWDAPVVTGVDAVEREFYAGGYLFPHMQLLDKDDPSFLLTYAEVQFYLAEAAQRGWTSGSAADYYASGVEAAMMQLSAYGLESDVTGTQISYYLAANPYVPANGLELINTQLWINYFLNGHEAFANWRRSDFPALQTPPVVDWEPQLHYGISRRLPYPDEEYDRNFDNLSVAIQKLESQGATDAARYMDGRVWWDAN